MNKQPLLTTTNQKLPTTDYQSLSCVSRAGFLYPVLVTVRFLLTARLKHTLKETDAASLSRVSKRELKWRLRSWWESCCFLRLADLVVAKSPWLGLCLVRITSFSELFIWSQALLCIPAMLHLSSLSSFPN